MEEKLLVQNSWRIAYYLSSLNFLPFSNCLVSTFSLTQCKNKHQNTLHLKSFSQTAHNWILLSSSVWQLLPFHGCVQHVYIYYNHGCGWMWINHLSFLSVSSSLCFLLFYSAFFWVENFLAFHFIPKVDTLAKPLCCFHGGCRFETVRY